MNEQITIHGSPEKSVFGVIGKDVLTDEDKFYIKVENDSKNTGWKEIPPTPTQTPTVTVTPSKTPIVTRQVIVTQTPTISTTPNITPTPTNTSPLTTQTPSSTSFKSYINYTIDSSVGGRADRLDGPTPTGTIDIGTGIMQLQATADEGYHFDRWNAPEAVILSNPYATNPTATGFGTTSDVTITAVFASDNPPSGPRYIVNGVRDYRGILYFVYEYAPGNYSVYSTTGFPNEIVLNAACAISIDTNSPIVGFAELTGEGC